MGPARLLLVLLAACGAASASKQRLLVETTDSGQTSVAWSLPDQFKESPDLPMNEPPLARSVTGYEPEGIHLTMWQHTPEGWEVLVSWQTGEALQSNGTEAVAPHDPKAVSSLVRWGAAGGQLDQTTEGNASLVYKYAYWPNLTATGEEYTYHSPILHHVLLTGLAPGRTVFYSVGDPEHGWSEELSFTTPATGFPLRLGIVGDLGETANSSATLDKLVASDPDLVLLLGDHTYADVHLAGDSGGTTTATNMYTSDQPRWDGWARLTEPLLSRKPMLSVRGNHEIEQLLAMDNLTAVAPAARYPLPQDPSVINTAPNPANYFLDQSGTSFRGTGGRARFKNESGYQPSSAYYSLDVPGVAHLVMLNNYMPWGEGSAQHAWLLDDLAKVDREQTPWLVVSFHAAAYHNYAGHFKQADTFMAVYEDVFYRHRVDLVYSGHVHAYERTRGVYKYQPDDCGPVYTLIGDGGNVEGLYTTFIDAQPQKDYCADPAKYKLPGYQPIPGEKPVITLQDGLFCPTSQPAWSVYREPTFGHGVLELINGTHAAWRWVRTMDVETAGKAGGVDDVIIAKPKPGTCSHLASVPAPAPAPTTAVPRSSAGARARSAALMLLQGALAVAAAAF